MHFRLLAYWYISWIWRRYHMGRCMHIKYGSDPKCMKSTHMTATWDAWYLPICMKSTHMYEIYPRPHMDEIWNLPIWQWPEMHEIYPYAWNLPTCMKSTHDLIWMKSTLIATTSYSWNLPTWHRLEMHEMYPHGRHLRCMKSTHVHEIYPCAWNLPMCMKSTHVYEIYPCAWNLPTTSYLCNLPIWQRPHKHEIYQYGSDPMCMKSFHMAATSFV